MSRPTSTHSSQDQIRAAAADWFARLQAEPANAEVQSDFAAWRNSDPQHALAYAQCCAVWELTQGLRDNEAISAELQELRANAPASDPATESIAGDSKSANAWWLNSVKLTAAAAVLLVGLVFFFSYQQPQVDIYSTGVGEQKTIALSDGSSVTLNTRSRIAVSYSKGLRKLTLENGEAYFVVAKDANRPFDVWVDGHRVRAVGTEFNVGLIDWVVNVDVTEGVVEFFTEADSDRASASLAVGQAVRLGKGKRIPLKTQADLAHINAWQAQKIYFNERPLSQAVREYNRYLKQQLVVVDEELNHEKITGIFYQNDLDAFIFSLEHALNARVERQGQYIFIMRK